MAITQNFSLKHETLSIVPHAYNSFITNTVCFHFVFFVQIENHDLFKCASVLCALNVAVDVLIQYAH